MTINDQCEDINYNSETNNECEIRSDGTESIIEENNGIKSLALYI